MSNTEHILHYIMGWTYNPASKLSEKIIFGIIFTKKKNVIKKPRTVKTGATKEYYRFILH
jgi:hypothetical protein